MQTKTFRAKDMLTALKEVQAEFGPDAMIISMREVPAGSIWAAWRKPGVEVIASKSNKSIEKKPLDSTTTQLGDESHSITKPTSEELKREIKNLKMLVTGQKLSQPIQQETNSQVISETTENKPKKTNFESYKFDPSDFVSIKEPGVSPFEKVAGKSEEIISKLKPVKVEKTENTSIPTLPPLLQEFKQKLNDQGIRSDIIEKIINTNQEALSPAILNDYDRLAKYIHHQLEVCLPSARKSLALVPSRIMTLVGLSGSGKTSCCAKLASFYMITMGKTVVWIEADTIRTSAISEARTYTETLGIPLFLAYSPQELSEIIDSQSDADLILIDTASCNPWNEDSVIELGSYLSNIPSGNIFMVNSATTKEQDLLQIEKYLKPFGLKGFILTKTDETGFFGAGFNLLSQSKAPLYFFTCGNKIFGDLKPGSPDHMASAVLSGKFPRE